MTKPIKAYAVKSSHDGKILGWTVRLTEEESQKSFAKDFDKAKEEYGFCIVPVKIIEIKDINKLEQNVINQDILEQCAKKLVESVGAKWEKQTEDDKKDWINDALVVIKEYNVWLKE